MLFDLIDAEPRILFEADVLRILRDCVRQNLLPVRGRQAPATTSLLYPRYGGTGFPIHKVQDKRLPRWRDLSPWMKVQLALLVLGEHGFYPFKLQLHDDLWADLTAKRVNHREYMRDRIWRTTRDTFGKDHIPLYFMVIEDRDNHGEFVRPHGHGSVQIRRYAVAGVTDGRWGRNCRRAEATLGADAAELMAGKWALREALKGAAGLLTRDRVASTGIDQCRNVWVGNKTLPIFNDDWVTYILKNVHQTSPDLDENRLIYPYTIMGEAKALWAQIRGDGRRDWGNRTC